jgi:hypothetical protein
MLTMSMRIILLGLFEKENFIFFILFSKNNDEIQKITSAKKTDKNIGMIFLSFFQIPSKMLREKNKIAGIRLAANDDSCTGPQ